MDSHLILLLVFGFLAGLMDAAVGGGGLLQIPALFNTLPASVPVTSVMGINKFASFSGTFMASVQFIRKIPMPWKMLLPAAVLAFIASYGGAKLVAYLPVQYLKPAMLVIMAVMFVYTFFKKDLGQVVRTTALTRKETALGLLFGVLIGFYDGLFGPGTGSLLTFVFVRFFAYDFLTATASAKIINLTTNLAALSFFIPNNHIVWAWALPLALANLSGGIVGTHLAIRGGSKFLRYAFMALLCVLIGKFGWDLLHAAY
ncbi:sulfite exporter TauE/SafE family protein [Neisseria animaloris]|uniref:sulfite exporter TauE/SafE family protein n=1 Tax=Neisseria animaloris TaxID=326522 RepID=UPI0039E0C649